MKLNSTLVLIALAFAGASASAATVGTWTVPPAAGVTDPTVGPAGAFAHGDFGSQMAVDDVYNFNIASTSDLLTLAKEFESFGESLTPADFSLYKGAYSGTTGSMVGSSMSFAGGSTVQTTYHNLVAGNYYFEVTGMAAGIVGADYNLAIFANTPSNPLPAIPEPTNVALMLAGLGLFGFMAKRRARQQ